MTNDPNRYYNEFKPLRNKVRMLHFDSALKRLHTLSQKKPAAIVPEISEFLFICLVGYADGVTSAQEEKYWNRIIHEAMNLNNRISADSMEKGLWKWLRTMSLNQLKSHNNYYFHAVYRYYSIFSEAKISAHIERVLGIPYKAYFICGLWLHAVFVKELAYPKKYFTGRNNGGPLFSKVNMDKTLELLTLPLTELKAALKESIVFNEDLFNFQGYPHVIYPIFEQNDLLYCMFPDHLLKQLVSGIYYAAGIGDNASNVPAEFGSGFENYVGTVLQKNNEKKTFEISAEIIYAIGKNANLKTSDWIIETDDSIVFLECKTKRPSLSAKKMVDIDDKGPEDLLAMAKAISQLYKVYGHYKAGKIPGMTYDPEKAFFPIVITLEEWFAGGPDTSDGLTDQVKEILTTQSLTVEDVEDCRFRVYSINTFETDVQMMFFLGFKSYFEHLSAGTLNEATKDFKWIPYFEQEFKELFMRPE